MTHVCTTHKRLALALAALSFFFLAACGGGGDGGNSFFAAPPGSISGVATKGPVSGATVKAFAVSSGVAGRQIGIATTDANGAFTMAIGDHAGAVMLQLTGGTYTDEATGTTMPMASVDGMTAVLPGIVAGRDTTGIQMTPLTTMAQAISPSKSIFQHRRPLIIAAIGRSAGAMSVRANQGAQLLPASSP